MSRAQDTADLLQQAVPSVHCSAKIREQLSDTNVLVIASTSKEPLYSPADFASELIVSLGADKDDQHELDPAWAERAAIFVDTHDSVRYGDLKFWAASGYLDHIRIPQLLDLLGSNRIDLSKKYLANHTRIFISTGTALFDNLTIGYILKMKND